MGEIELTLNSLNIGEKAKVKELLHSGDYRRHLIELGLTPDSDINCIMESAFGGIRAYTICSAVIAIRKEDAEKIIIYDVKKEEV